MLKHQTLKDLRECLNTLDPIFDDMLVSFNSIDLYNEITRRDDDFEDFGKQILQVQLKWTKDERSAKSEIVAGPPEQFRSYDKYYADEMSRTVVGQTEPGMIEAALDEFEDVDIPPPIPAAQMQELVEELRNAPNAVPAVFGVQGQANAN